MDSYNLHAYIFRYLSHWTPGECHSFRNSLIFHIQISIQFQPFISTLWQKRWDKEVGKQLHAIMSYWWEIFLGKWRKHDIIINRRRIGHTRLTHSHNMDKRPFLLICNFFNLLRKPWVDYCAYFECHFLNYTSMTLSCDWFDAGCKFCQCVLSVYLKFGRWCASLMSMPKLAITIILKCVWNVIILILS